MKTIDLTKEKIRSLPHVDIDSLDLNSANQVLEGAERAYMRQKQIIRHLGCACEVNEKPLEIGTYEYDFMTEDCFNPVYGDCNIDILESVKCSINKSIDGLEDFIKLLQNHIDWLQNDAHQECCHTQAAKEEFYATR